MPLRIKQVEIFLVNIPLRFSIQHALASRTANTTGFFILSTENGIFSIGEFLGREYVGGEKIEDCIRYLHKLSPLLLQAPISNPLEFIKSVWDQHADEAGKYGAMCALDLALLDLWGKQEGKSAAELIRPNVFQTERIAPQYSAVYPFASGLKLSALHFFYRTWIGTECIKVKGKGRIDDDLAYVAAVQKAFSYPVDIRLDLNGSLSTDRAEEYFSKMLESNHGIRWFEQPFPKHDWTASQKFQKQFASQAIFCADESVCTMQDLERAIRTGAFRAINIRIGKNGGLVNALALYQKAIENNLEVQLGCYVGESSVLAYAGLHFAAVADRLRYYEGCFGNYLSKWDVIVPSLTFTRKGQVSFKQLPHAGLVPFFNLDRLRRKAFKTYCFE